MPVAERTGFLEAIDADDERGLRQVSHERELPAGARVFGEGEPSYEVFFLIDGSVKVTRTSREGQEVVLAVRSEGDVLGETSAVDGLPRSAQAWTLEPTRLLAVPVKEFRRLLDERTSLCRALVDVLCERMREGTDQALELGTDDALTRVGRRLMEFGRDDGERTTDGLIVELPVSQQEVADRCGLSREAVVKALRALRALGWIEQDGRRVVLTDEAALRERVAWVDERAL
jgi:CRP/FNR family transcriptional regulator